MPIGKIVAAVFAVFSCVVFYDNFRLSMGDGTPAIRRPGAWVNIWNAAGAVFIVFSSRSAWHLLWWVPAGLLLAMIYTDIERRSKSSLEL